jgi:hypothetical protein
VHGGDELTGEGGVGDVAALERVAGDRLGEVHGRLVGDGGRHPHQQHACRHRCDNLHVGPPLGSLTTGRH